MCYFTLNREFKIINPVSNRTVDSEKTTWKRVHDRNFNQYHSAIINTTKELRELKSRVAQNRFIIKAALHNVQSKIQSVLLVNNLSLEQQLYIIAQKNKNKLDQYHPVIHLRVGAQTRARNLSDEDKKKSKKKVAGPMWGLEKGKRNDAVD